MALLMSVVLIFSGMAAEPGRKILSGHVPAVVQQLQSKGILSADTNLDLAIGLPLRNRDVLTNLLQQIYDPASTNYHHYLSPDQFTAQFGPTEQDYQEVLDFARTNGLSVTRTYSNRMVLDVRGRVSDVQNAFHVTLRVYRHPTESRDFYAPDAEPSVPSALQIQDIGGLDNYRRPHPQYQFKASRSITNAAAKATTGSGPLGNYIGDDFRNAYVPGTALNGANQTIALVQFDGYLASDINTYENLTGRPNVPLQNVLIDGFNGLPTGNGGEVEVSLDIEMSISMAPGIAGVILYEGNPYNFIPNDVLNAIATANSARQVSCSWGWSGGPTATTDQIFQQMAVQGQTFYDAVGDSDAFTTGASSVNGVDNPLLPNAPSDSPYITQVGGTTLTMTGAGGAYASETVWNWDVRYGANYDGIGSSGGISSYYSIPYWQTNINMSASGGSTTFRNTPDVALTADDVLVIADGGIEYVGVGGTSCAAPLWAGFTALVNQLAANTGGSPVGFINPALYSIAAGPNYNNCFHDIRTGNNEWTGSPNQFTAVRGYDLCTGLGTPNGTNLIYALTAVSLTNTITHLSPPPAPYGSTLSALNGGNPNGNWYLFLQDDKIFDSGVISNGWLLSLTTANPVGYAADLALTMTSSSSSIPVGSNVVYTISVTNYGPSASSNAVVSDTLTSGVTLVSSSATQGSVSPNGQQVIWNVGSLATNSGAQLLLTVRGNSTGSIVSSAIVSALTPDPNPDDDSASATVGVVIPSAPQLSANFTGSGGLFKMSVTGTPGQNYTIQASTNLVTGPWIPIYTNSGSFIFTDPNVTNYPYRFYRALIGP